jgi:hypothetical protein
MKYTTSSVLSDLSNEGVAVFIPPKSTLNFDLSFLEDKLSKAYKPQTSASQILGELPFQKKKTTNGSFDVVGQ